MNPIYVFLGPTLPREQAQSILDAIYLPPVARGDVYALVARRPRAICLVDGYFERVPAVMHKEILYAMAEGITVLGSSSMGAVRAAELARFGMVGIGRIFRDFLQGVLEDDDEVAVSHATAEFAYRPLSVAMVNIRYGLLAALTDGVVTRAVAEQLMAAAKDAFYADRSWSALWAEGRRLGLDLGQLPENVNRTRPDAGRDDALALLQHVRKMDARPLPRASFAATQCWNHMVATDGPTRILRMAELLAGGT